MAEAKKGDKAEQPSEEAMAATSEQYAGTAGGEPTTPRQLAEQSAPQAARNPKDWGADVNVDDLPAVPTSGMFMSAEESTEDPAPTTADEPAEARRGGEAKR